MWVQMTRLIGRPPNGPARIVSQVAAVCDVFMPVSTSVQPAPSSMAQRLMWFNEKGSGIRCHFTPGATSSISPGAGTFANGYLSSNRVQASRSGGLVESLQKRAAQRFGKLSRGDLLHHGGIPLIGPAAHPQKTQRRDLYIAFAKGTSVDSGSEDAADLVEIFLAPGTDFRALRPLQLAVVLKEGAHIARVMRDFLRMSRQAWINICCGLEPRRCSESSPSMSPAMCFWWMAYRMSVLLGK